MTVDGVTYNNWTFNSDGKSNISKAGITKLGARLACDIEDVAPTWGASLKSEIRVTFSDQTGTTSDPKLTITYTPASVPTVTTQAATSIAANQAVLNGNITDLGSEDVTEWGFYYVEGAGTPTSSDTVISSTGTASTGAYTETPTGLKDNTLYSARSFATNSVGTDTGDVVQFTTTKLKKIVAGTTGAMSATLENLKEETKYYIRSYATNSAGTSYGTETDFTTTGGMITRTLTESISTTDTTTKDTARIIEDGATVTDTVSLAKIVQAILTEIITVISSMTFSKLLGRVLSEAITITDNIYNGKIPDIWSKVVKKITTWTKTPRE